MTEEPRVIDGGDRRKARIREMLARIHSAKGMTDIEIKTFMFVKYGLKHKRTAEYINEAHLGNLIEANGLKWVTTGNYHKALKYLYS